jgi:hypothetical protein
MMNMFTRRQAYRSLELVFAVWYQGIKKKRPLFYLDARNARSNGNKNQRHNNHAHEIELDLPQGLRPKKHMLFNKQRRGDAENKRHKNPLPQRSTQPRGDHVLPRGWSTKK